MISPLTMHYRAADVRKSRIFVKQLSVVDKSYQLHRNRSITFVQQFDVRHVPTYLSTLVRPDLMTSRQVPRDRNFHIFFMTSIILLLTCGQRYAQFLEYCTGNQVKKITLITLID